jgi:hypothetical protein
MSDIPQNGSKETGDLNSIGSANSKNGEKVLIIACEDGKPIHGDGTRGIIYENGKLIDSDFRLEQGVEDAEAVALGKTNTEKTTNEKKPFTDKENVEYTKALSTGETYQVNLLINKIYKLDGFPEFFTEQLQNPETKAKIIKAFEEDPTLGDLIKNAKPELSNDVDLIEVAIKLDKILEEYEGLYQVSPGEAFDCIEDKWKSISQNKIFFINADFIKSLSRHSQLLGSWVEANKGNLINSLNNSQDIDIFNAIGSDQKNGYPKLIELLESLEIGKQEIFIKKLKEKNPELADRLGDEFRKKRNSAITQQNLAEQQKQIAQNNFWNNANKNQFDPSKAGVNANLSSDLATMNQRIRTLENGTHLINKFQHTLRYSDLDSINGAKVDSNKFNKSVKQNPIERKTTIKYSSDFIKTMNQNLKGKFIKIQSSVDDNRTNNIGYIQINGNIKNEDFLRTEWNPGDGGKDIKVYDLISIDSIDVFDINGRYIETVQNAVIDLHFVIQHRNSNSIEGLTAKFQDNKFPDALHTGNIENILTNAI